MFTLATEPDLSECNLREFRRMVHKIIESDTLRDYRLILDDPGADLTYRVGVEST